MTSPIPPLPPVRCGARQPYPSLQRIPRGPRPSSPTSVGHRGLYSHRAPPTPTFGLLSVSSGWPSGCGGVPEGYWTVPPRNIGHRGLYSTAPAGKNSDEPDKTVARGRDSDVQELWASRLAGPRHLRREGPSAARNSSTHLLEQGPKYWAGSYKHMIRIKAGDTFGARGGV